MTTPYIDPQIIFASDAPTQDKPPVFNNYIKGMDETRSNDGRPTIKQFNFIQQQNDFKFLYIHERGACLPFVEGFPYENNAIVFKDGLIQQKNGVSWVIPFMRGSQNLAELTDISQARTKLDVYSKSEALGVTNNLSELADKAAARTNLDVYSKAETNGIAATPNATETVAGKAKIATTAIAKAGTNNTDFITAKKLRDVLNDQAFGINQTWKNVTPSRVSGTIYTNTTGKPIAIHIASVGVGGGESYVLVEVNTVTFKASRGGASTSSNFTSDLIIIPTGATYKITSSNATINEWVELS